MGSIYPSSVISLQQTEVRLPNSRWDPFLKELERRSSVGGVSSARMAEEQCEMIRLRWICTFRVRFSV